MPSSALRALIPLIDFSPCSPALSFSVEVGTTGGGTLALLRLSLGGLRDLSAALPSAPG